MTDPRDDAQITDAATGKATVPTAPDAVLTPFSLLLGAKISDRDGHPIGIVADVMMAAAEGRIVYVALSVGGFVGIGERLFAVPWACFVIDPVGGALAVDFASAVLDGRDGFDKDSWPSAADARLAALPPGDGLV